MNTTKARAFVAATVSGIAAFVAWLANVPPEQQTALLSPLVDLMPLSWRDGIGLFMRILASSSGIYAAFQAAKSGPQVPPVNSVNE